MSLGSCTVPVQVRRLKYVLLTVPLSWSSCRIWNVADVAWNRVQICLIRFGVGRRSGKNAVSGVLRISFYVGCVLKGRVWG